LTVLTCPGCSGGRLKPELLAVRIGGENISQLCGRTVDQAIEFFEQLELTGYRREVADQVRLEVVSRLSFLQKVGLGYIALDRATETLSGGEAQRIRLATQIGNQLMGVLYVLDEPTIGLHPRDTERLLSTLTGLQQLGNTLVVVEHDPAVMRRADHIIDLGPGAGEAGGRIIDQGTPAQLMAGPGITGAYLSGRLHLPVPDQRRTARAWVAVGPSSKHNLQGITARFPRSCLTVVTGVSGSGKSTLVLDVLAPTIRGHLKQQSSLKKKERTGIQKLVVVDQRPISKSPRSAPITYCGLLTPIRELLAATPLARQRGYSPRRFSYNIPDGRCPHCEGRGAILVEMHFLPDIWTLCADCGGRRFTRETLDIRSKGLSIADVLDLSAADALAIFSSHRAITRPLPAVVDVGLGYLRLGQPTSTLSGGEAQRLKLSRELAVGPRAPETCFLLDEPTTGLHFTDIEKLLMVLQRLVDAGHMVVLIEHHLDVIRAADHVIDLGPEGGDEGGQIVAVGTPEALAAVSESWTGLALR